MPNKLSLKGCFPPIATPFDNQGRVDHEHLARNLEKWQKTPLAGFAVLGSNGEFVFLTEAEKLEVWHTARSVIKKDRLFIAGTGCESTSETLSLTEKAAQIGADAGLVVTPHYYKGKMDHRALVTYYITLAEKSPIPIILYNVPGFTGVDVNAETIIEIAQHPNVIGCKDSSGNVVKIGQVVGAAPQHFRFLAGSGSFLLPALVMGAVGGIMALAGVAPYSLDKLIINFEKSDLKKAQEIQIRLIPVNAAVTAKFGIAGLKSAMDFVGMYGGPVRPPLRSLDDAQKQELEVILKKGLDPEDYT